MKYNFLFVLTFCSLLSFNSYSGGISDGGGNTLNPTPTQINDVYEIATLSRKYLIYKFTKVQASQIPFANLLFGRQSNIFKVLADYPVVVLKNESCKDQSNQDVDGSINYPSTNQICISALRIAQKTTAETFEPQTIALVVHEYGHFLGLNESEADLLQREFYKLIRPDFLNPKGDFAESVNFHQKLSSRIKKVNEQIQKVLFITSPEADSQWEDYDIYNNYYGYFLFPGWDIYQALRQNNPDRMFMDMFAVWQQHYLAEQYLDIDGNIHGHSKANYLKHFGNNTVITMNDLRCQLRYGKECQDIFPNDWVIYRIDTRERLHQEMLNQVTHMRPIIDFMTQLSEVK